MTGLPFGLIVDLVLLVMLGATIFIGWKLMSGLRHFRESRSEMEGLLNRLTAQIERAENGIRGLQISAQSAGGQLEDVLKESKLLADELQLMNQSGNNLADRLEKLAEKNRIASEQNQLIQQAKPHRQDKSFHHMSTQEDDDDLYFIDDVHSKGFSIQDRDPGNHDELFGDEEEGQTNPTFKSEAERDLYHALIRGKGRKGALGQA